MLSAYAAGVNAHWPADQLYRLIVRGFPREYHANGAARRRELVGDEPPLTGTAWDALLAAVVEHVTRLHGETPPAWVDRPERFLDEPWIDAHGEAGRRRKLYGCPAAFVRHGAFIDPRDLDERGGEVGR